jgi:hypothetical protein
VTDDLRTRLAGALTAFADLDPELADECADALLPLFEAHGRASAATALRRAADAADAVFRAGDSDEGETWAKWLRIRAAEAAR